jgi:hypothetical protein
LIKNLTNNILDVFLDWLDYGRRMIWWGEAPPRSLLEGLDLLNIQLWQCAELPTGKMVHTAKEMCKLVVEGQAELESVSSFYVLNNSSILCSYRSSGNHT